MGTDWTQWANLALGAAAFLLFIAGVAAALLQLRRQQQGADEEELARWDSAGNVLQTLLRGAVTYLVTQAEKDYGPGTGEIKRSAVLTQLIQLLPEQWRVRFNIDILSELIETGLEHAKKLWVK